MEMGTITGGGTPGPPVALWLPLTVNDNPLANVPDAVIGVPVLIVFLIAIFVAGKVMAAFKNRHFTRAWAPLVPVIDGKVVGDGGPATTSWLAGTYQGRRVQASMIPNRNRYTGETGHYYNSFEIELLDVAGKGNWSIIYHQRVLGLGTEGWRVEAADPGVARALEEGGACDIGTQLGYPKLRYWVSRKALCSSGEVAQGWAPPPERFREELELLLRLAELSERVNR